jgi:ubiquinone/menaquinone biosynthesis C-methylase UbiE
VISKKEKTESMLQVEAFKALADGTRLRILQIVNEGSFNVNEIKEVLEMGQSRVSRHLKVLSDAGFLGYNREGSWVYYSIAKSNSSSEVPFPEKLLELILSNFSIFEKDKLGIDKILLKRTEKNRTYFDSVGKDWESIQKEVLNPEVYRSIITSYISKKSKHILDLGCGPGGLVPYLLDKTEFVTGVDSSPKMIEEAKSHFKKESRVNFMQALLEEIPFQEETIDSVVASMVLHHISNPPVVMNEVNRVLCDRGSFCIVELQKHNKEYMRDKFSDLWLGFEEAQLVEWLVYAGFYPKDIQRITIRDFQVIIIHSIKKRRTNNVHSNNRKNE